MTSEVTQLGFYLDQSRCAGCYTCQVACRDWHDLPAGQIQWRRVETIESGRFPDPLVVSLSLSCVHCENPLCVDACPARAIQKRQEGGIVVVDREACLGKDRCGMLCRDACPYTAPQFGPAPDAKMEKCDLCADRWTEGKKPICVEACPWYALDAGPLEALKAAYGDIRAVTGFAYSVRANPAIVFKPHPRSLR